jgi:hypothetical protein
MSTTYCSIQISEFMFAGTMLNVKDKVVPVLSVAVRLDQVLGT